MVCQHDVIFIYIFFNDPLAVKGSLKGFPGKHLNMVLLGTVNGSSNSCCKNSKVFAEPDNMNHTFLHKSFELCTF